VCCGDHILPDELSFLSPYLPAFSPNITCVVQ
jgi:hypothetical protein